MPTDDDSIDEEAVGAYSFNLRKSAGAEQSLARIRHALGKDWQQLNDEDLRSLDWVLKEAWARMDFYDWDKINLSAMNIAILDDLIEIGRRGLADKLDAAKAADQAAKILARL
ncbi:MAG TPA: hypothetical protein ENI11_05175 [Actinobacteria bacterium]|nr:hypothetical protein [Actinomycetota bacterium]